MGIYSTEHIEWCPKSTVERIEQEPPLKCRQYIVDHNVSMGFLYF